MLPTTPTEYSFSCKVQSMLGGTVVVVGAGDLGRQAHWLLRTQEAGVIRVAAFIADDNQEDSTWDGLPVTRRVPFADWPELLKNGDFLVGLGYRHLPMRRAILKDAVESGASIPNLIHPSAIVADEVLRHPSMERPPVGVMLYPGAILDQSVALADGVIVNVGAVVCHDSILGASSFLGPRATLCGSVTIGWGTFIGAGAIIRNGLVIGNNVRVAMGSVVTAESPDGQCVAGNPARPVSRLTF